MGAKSAFWQLALDESSSHLCTFATPWGPYRFLWVPFGLNIAPELFQQANDSTFERQGLVKPYFNDILVASRRLDEHEVHLRKVLSIAQAKNNQLNYMLQLDLPSVTYLGHQLTWQGITPDLIKVKAINAIPAPTSKAELLRFLGMATYTEICPRFLKKAIAASRTS